MFAAYYMLQERGFIVIHQYKNNGYNIVLDVNSGAVHVVDDVVYDVLPYLEKKETNERAYLNTGETVEVVKEDVSEGKTDWQSQKEEQAKKRKIQNRVKKIEEEIESLEEKLSELEEQFQDPAVATNSAKLGKLHSEQVEVQEKLDGLYEEWEALASD